MERMARHTAAITISNMIMVDKFSIRNVISAHILSQKLVLSNPRIQLNTSCTFCQEEEPRFFPICPISSHLNFFSKYLETILMLGHTKPHVRSIDIANELDFSKPSVSVAMKNLRQNGYIQVDGNGYITLTDAGRKIAETMYERHTMLSSWLVYLGVDQKTAVEDACRMEHVLSADSFEAIKRHITSCKELSPDMYVAK